MTSASATETGRKKGVARLESVERSSASVPLASRKSKSASSVAALKASSFPPPTPRTNAVDTFPSHPSTETPSLCEKSNAGPTHRNEKIGVEREWFFTSARILSAQSGTVPVRSRKFESAYSHMSSRSSVRTARPPHGVVSDAPSPRPTSCHAASKTRSPRRSANVATPF